MVQHEITLGEESFSSCPVEETNCQAVAQDTELQFAIEMRLNHSGG